MNHPEPVGAETKVAEFAIILSPGHGEEVPVLVGGHAVNLWSEYCVRAFIAEFAAFVADGQARERPLVNLLGETLGVVSDPAAAKAANLWGFDYSAVWPMDELRRCGSEKVARWLEHRFS